MHSKQLIKFLPSLNRPFTWCSPTITSFTNNIHYLYMKNNKQLSEFCMRQTFGHCCIKNTMLLLLNFNPTINITRPIIGFLIHLNIRTSLSLAIGEWVTQPSKDTQVNNTLCWISDSMKLPAISLQHLITQDLY